MTFLQRSASIWLLLFCWSSFIPVLLLSPRQELFEVLNAIVFSLSSGIVVAYALGVFYALQRPLPELYAGDALQVGVGIGWLANMIIFGILWYWRLTGKDAAIIDHAINAFTRWMVVSSGFMHLAAAGAVLTETPDGFRLTVPPRSYIRAGIIVALGVMLGVVIITIAFPIPTRL